MSHVFTFGTFGRRQKKADPPVQDTYTLACCIAGDKTDFAIVVPSTAYIDQLAQSIYEKGVSNRFKCHILDMTLWKADIELGTLVSRVNLDDYKSTMEGLFTSRRRISELWDRQPPENRLHIIVEIPAEDRTPTGTSQIPPICLRLGCLLVKNDGTPAGGSFVLYEYEDRPVSEFAERIKRDMLSDVTVFPRYIRLWKPDPPISSLPSGVLSGVNALQLDQPGNERSVVELDNTLRLGRFFTANQQEGQIHVIAQLPLDREKVKGKPAFEPEITFSIPSETHFQSLTMADISAEEVESGPVENMPPFLQKFYDSLVRKRCVPANSFRASFLSDLFHKFENPFSDYFQIQDQTEKDPENPDMVTDSEIGQYAYIVLSKKILSIDRFEVSKEGQIGATFLHVLAGAIERRGGALRACLTAWQFPLLAASREGELKTFRYIPMNDFRLEIEHFSFCLLEVVSSKKAELDSQADLWRMILQASCLARLGNKLRVKTDDPVVIVAIFIDSQLQAHEYLVYQPDPSRKKVLYRETRFNLTQAKGAFEFIFRLYNLLSRLTEDSRNFEAPMTELAQIKHDVPEGIYPSLTSGRDRKRKRDAGGGVGQQHTPSGPLGESSVQASLKEAGYQLTPTDNMLVPITPLKPTMRNATSSDGVHVVLKVVDDDTDELPILKYLNQIKSAANHTIELHGIVHNPIAKVIALRWRIPLKEYFRYHNPPEAATSFPEQFLEGVGFLHEHRIAHQDLKPGNVVVDAFGVERKHTPRLVIIDFGLSTFVEDENTMIEGYCGTPPWVAPEVGTCDGPSMTYSPIRADRWACGKLVQYLEQLAGVGDGSQGQIPETLIYHLMNADPRARPAVKEVLDAYRVSTKGGVKRVAKAEETDGTLKRARMNSADSIGDSEEFGTIVSSHQTRVGV